MKPLLLLSCLIALTSWLPAERPLTVTWLVMPAHGLTAELETPEGKACLIDTGGVRADPAYGNTEQIVVGTKSSDDPAYFVQPMKNNVNIKAQPAKRRQTKSPAAAHP